MTLLTSILPLSKWELMRKPALLQLAVFVGATAPSAHLSTPARQQARGDQKRGSKHALVVELLLL